MENIILSIFKSKLTLIVFLLLTLLYLYFCDILGEYAGFDENQCTSRTGGKGQVIRNLKEKHGYETVVMIGDGITDWEACPPADLFIGMSLIVSIFITTLLT